MKLGFISSGALHLLVVLIVWLGLPHIKRDPPKLDELIFVKLADEDEVKVKKIMEIIDKNFDLSPRGIREMLKLNNPIYQVTSAYGHFGRKPTNKGEFTWEKTDKADLFKL